jgi:hypothetical protein
VARLPRIPRPRPLLPPDPARGEIAVLAAGTLVTRIYFAGGRYPGGWNAFRAFGPTSGRFDHHRPPVGDHPDRAILYAASDITTAVAEVFQETGQVDVVSDEPYLAVMRLGRPVRLLSLRSNWPTRAGASQALASGSRATARGWSIAIHDDLPDIEGLEYASAMHHPGVSYAFYERAQDAFEPAPAINLPLAHRGLRPVLRNAAAALNYGLVLPPASTRRGMRRPGS